MNDAPVVNWDEVDAERRDVGELHGTWRAIETGPVGVARVQVDAGCRSTPVHVHGAEEEIYFVLGGSGLAWLDGATYAIAAGDTLVCVADGPAHTLIAGPDGLDVLAFGENVDPPLVRLPHAGVIRRGAFWLDALGTDPLEREAAAGPLDVRAPTLPRPPCLIALHDAPLDELERGEYRCREYDVGSGAGSQRTGLRHSTMPAAAWSCPPHWHSAEHELFLVLEGDGELLLFANDATLAEQHPLRAGSVVRRPAGTNLAHALRAGDGGMTYLAYGMRRSDEVVFYPRSRKAWLGRALVRVELADDYWEGELS